MGEHSPSEREMDILKVLWEIGPATVRQVRERMCPDGELAFNTIQTLLRIMDEKGLVSHRLEGRTFIYQARHSRDRVAKRFLDKVFDGAMDQLVLSLLQNRRSEPTELEQLEEVIAQARRKQPASSRKERRHG